MTTRALLLLVAAATIGAIATSPAEARHRTHHARHHHRPALERSTIDCNMQGCHPTTGTIKYDAPIQDGPRRSVARAEVRDANGSVVGGRPHGCPYQFCGCEASLYVFGEIRKNLNLASNWMRQFARAHAAPGMVAARNHHVMVLMRHVSGSDWLVHDGNSGNHKTREHVRSIAGYTIVNPHSRQYASAE